MTEITPRQVTSKAMELLQPTILLAKELERQAAARQRREDRKANLWFALLVVGLVLATLPWGHR